ncbi:hypothetical protein [Leyella stercorea]|uniref:hypothetical protein n=1 Tax=Leyella stercorea TaxID=363265 RepID=UPI002432ECB5|nr:hypothetical protein [Leyella stercorea]
MVNMNILPLTLSVMLHILMNFLCFQHPRRPLRASASTIASICVDRREPSAYACKSS